MEVGIRLDLQSAERRIKELEDLLKIAHSTEAGLHMVIKARDKQIAEAKEALHWMFKAADELAAEGIQHKRAANWGIINEAYLKAQACLKEE